ncbi:hypothetical protein EUGRSUZ_C02667 [Eucalyptus grandis]|uniref:Uncharacterized protein n=2 Tax=Eucalyptus grandis TaxID=71139 RepID=A0ACC3LGB5_EUCGR|nr:hypothetical protein EUGRSUZ_C02667 [Eucalyptus grandis]
MGHYVPVPYLQTNRLKVEIGPSLCLLQNSYECARCVLTQHMNCVGCVTQKGAFLANIQELKGSRHPDMYNNNTA